MDTANKFLVGALGDKIIIQGGGKVLAPLSKEDALLLAAWLVALAALNPAKDFQPILDAVLGT
jgi:hypothetical protein